MYLTNEEWFTRAEGLFPGGVNSPARAYAAVGGTPPVFVRGEGAYVYDVEGRRYIDYLAAYGPLILGHARPEIVAAITRAASEGTVLGTTTTYEVEFAERLQSAVPSLERLRFTTSGTEGVMSAIRVARAFTGRTKLVKFSGCYHGHSDPVLGDAGSGTATVGLSHVAGVPAETLRDVWSLPYNDPETLRTTMRKNGESVAAVLVEPVVGNFGIVPPEPEFLRTIHEEAARAGALVIYDEVITAFRFTYGAVQSLLGYTPDLTVLGKIIGGGVPIGAFGGRKEILDLLAPLGPTFQAGTFAGNPLAVRAGLALLDVLAKEPPYAELERKAKHLAEGLTAAARRYRLPFTVNRYGGAFSTHFVDGPVRTYADARRADDRLFSRFFHGLRERGILIAPSKYEAWFTMVPHTWEDVESTLRAAEDVFAELARIA
ncbi:MAG: Glutamate-1-semialdehyde aminotransferase [Brockia lithotrophica]|uniref:Glutamate-1-semialdehyde 2,1-aminomutase n=1 Tax=Brockia lithotrophica TaxID=933949 RepID=A0A2T5G3X3_9BACL|nr:MAG: Glutamate-1-semialdehyde aminotransferase [Brockia lithotrophica]